MSLLLAMQSFLRIWRSIDTENGSSFLEKVISEHIHSSTSNSKSASDFIPAADLQLKELPALPMPTASLKAQMEQIVQKQIPINL